jgi:hypothetical protein
MRALASIVCLVAACDAGVKPEPAAKAVPKSTAPEKQPVAVAGFDLTYLPADTDVVVHVDVAKLRQSKMWATYSKDVGKMIAPGFGDCTFDPLSTASTVDIGIAVESKPNVFVIRGIDHHAATACFNSLKGEEGRSKATYDGELITVTSALGAKRLMTFVDKQTLVMRTTKGPEQGLQQVVQQGAPLAKDAQFVAAVARANSSAAIVAVSRPGSEALAKQMKQSGTHLSFFYGSLNLTDRLEVMYAMDVETASEAKTLVDTMKSQLDNQSVKQMFDRLEARVQDKTVTLEIVMNEQKLANMAGMFRGLIPAS